jgi:large subunit ribosomal protein L18
MKATKKSTYASLRRRHLRVRKKVHGSAERPRLTVRRSIKHVTAVIVDDDAHRTLVQVASTAKNLGMPDGEGSLKMKRSEAVGAEIARLAKEQGITKVAFDRGGRRYHGRVKAVADAARKGGLEF